MSKFHVSITIPHHQTDPGQVIARHHFDSPVDAEKFADSVRRHPVGYGAEVRACGGCASFDVTRDEEEVGA